LNVIACRVEKGIVTGKILVKVLLRVIAILLWQCVGIGIGNRFARYC